MKCAWCTGLLALVLLGGCSPGNSSLVQHPQPQGTASARPAMGTAHFTIRIPARAAGLKTSFISSATQSVVITGGTAPTMINVSAGNSYNLDVLAPEGAATFTVTLYAGNGGQGAVLGTGTLAATIKPYVDNNLSVTVGGVPASIQLSLDNPTPRKGVAASLALTVTALDAAGQAIVGAYSTPVTLTNSDSSGVVTLGSTSLATSSGPVSVTYSGARNFRNATLGASASGASSASTVLTPQLAPNGGVVTTFAGHVPGGCNLPNGVAVDGKGNVFVADTSNQRVRKIDSSGNVTTLAGSGNQGFADGSGTNAWFSSPYGVAVDSSGNVFVADLGNNLIRKIDSSGNVTTLAGNGLGYLDGSGTNARFSNPSGVAVDSSGNVFVADTSNVRIRKIDSSGNVTTLAGSSAGFADGSGTNARFSNPSGVAVDSSGNVFVADRSNNRIRKIDSSGNVTTLAGSANPDFADGSGTNAKFQGATGVAVDSSGNVFVADLGNNLIRKIDSSGNVTTLAGNGLGYLDGSGTNAVFNSPYGVAVDSGGSVFVADSNNNLIRKIDASANVTTYAGSPAAINGTGLSAQFTGPNQVVLDSNGNLFVADQSNNAIRKIDVNGVVTTLAGAPPAGRFDGNGTAARFSIPAGLAIDSQGNLYVGDNTNNRIRKVTPAGVVSTILTGLNSPTHMASDSSDNIYVADTGNQRILKIASNGNVTTLAGGGAAGYVDGSGTNALFNTPEGLAMDTLTGNLYVADLVGNRIRRIDPNGNVTTVAGSGTAGSADGSGTAAQFTNPLGLAVDNDGNVWVADYNGNRIRKIDPNGNVTTLAGSSSSGTANGSGANAQFNSPAGIFADPAGILYVSDYLSSLIRKIQ